MMDSKELLFRKVLELLFPDTNQDINIDKIKNDLKERFSQWQTNKEYRSILGSLQPTYFYSTIYKISENDVEDIAKEMGINLPNEPNLSEFNLSDITNELAQKILEELKDAPEQNEYLLNFLSSRQKEKSFDIIDMTAGAKMKSAYTDHQSSNMKVIIHLENLIEKIRNGKILSLTVVALQDDNHASFWLPPTIDESEINEYFQPIITALQQSVRPLFN